MSGEKDFKKISGFFLNSSCDAQTTMTLWHVFIMCCDNALTHSKDTHSIMPFRGKEVHGKKKINFKKITFLKACLIHYQTFT